MMYTLNDNHWIVLWSKLICNGSYIMPHFQSTMLKWNENKINDCQALHLFEHDYIDLSDFKSLVLRINDKL